MLHHAVSYDPTLRHLDLYGNVNDEGAYQTHLTGKYKYTLHFYQVHKKGESRNNHKVKTCCFWSKRLYNPFTPKLGLEAKFEISDDKRDTKYNRTTNTNIKEGISCGNGQVSDPDVENVDIPGDDAPQGFVS